MRLLDRASALSVVGLLLGAFLAPAAVAAPPAGTPLSAARVSAPLAATMTPGTGNRFERPTFRLSAPCPRRSTNFYALIFGGRFPRDGQLFKDAFPLGMSTTKPFAFTTNRTFDDVAAEARVPLVRGAYRIRVVCQTDLSETLRVFEVRLSFNAARRYQVAAPARPTPRAPRAPASRSAQVRPDPSLADAASASPVATSPRMVPVAQSAPSAQSSPSSSGTPKVLWVGVPVAIAAGWAGWAGWSRRVEQRSGHEHHPYDGT